MMHTQPRMHTHIDIPLRRVPALAALLCSLLLAVAPGVRAADAPTPADLVRENALLKTENLRLKQELATLKGKDPTAETATAIKPVAGTATDPDTVNAPLVAVLGLLNDLLVDASEKETTAQKNLAKDEVFKTAKVELAKIDRVLLVGKVEDVVKSADKKHYVVVCAPLTKIDYKARNKRQMNVYTGSSFAFKMTDAEAASISPGEAVMAALKLTYVHEKAYTGPGVPIIVQSTAGSQLWVIGSTDYRLKVGDRLFKSE